MKSHRLGADVCGDDPVHDVGADSSKFPTGVNHVENHTVPLSKPVIKNKVGPYISNLIDGPGAFHGVEPIQAPSATHDQYLQAEQMATHPDYAEPIKAFYADPVPVIVVPPDGTDQTITIGRSAIVNVDITGADGGTGAAVEIVPKDQHRRRCLITNEHATIGVRIGGHRSEAIGGFLLRAGDTREFFTAGGLYAWPADGATVIPISWHGEYSQVIG